MLKVLAAIQFRSRGEWRNLPYLAISPAFLQSEVQKDCQNRKREIGVNATRKLSTPKDCILSITFFHVVMVLTQRRRGRRRCNVNLLSAMFLEGLWNVSNLESGMRNSRPFSFCYLWKIISHLQYFFGIFFSKL